MMKLMMRTPTFLLAGILALLAPRAADATCSVIPPDGLNKRAFVGALTSPFLIPGLTNDVIVVSSVCEHESRSVDPDFLAGTDADDYVITIAFTPADGPASLLVLAEDPTLCDGVAACVVDTLSEREIVEVPRPGGVERRLRFRFPDLAPGFGPARLGVRPVGAAQPVASELGDVLCRDATQGTYVACADEFYALDGSCRVGDEFLDEPFGGLVAIPKTDFSDICTSGCDSAPVGPVSLPVTTDRDGNGMFLMLYPEQLVRVARSDGLIEPRPRRVSISLEDVPNNGFADASYGGKPSSFTPEGFAISPPFNPFQDDTTSAPDVGLFGFVDGEAGVHVLPRRSCSDEPARACTADADCSGGASCGPVEFDLAQAGVAVDLPLAAASAGEAVELNSWLGGSLDDPAVAITVDEVLGGQPLNQDGVDDDFVGRMLDRTTGLYKQLRGVFGGRGLAQVRVARKDRDFEVPSIAAEDDKLVLLESEFAEGLASPLAGTTGAEALLADVNQNGRLDYNLRAFALPADPAQSAATSLLDENEHVSVLPDLRFDDSSNLVLSDGQLFFAYSPRKQQAHAIQRGDLSSDGTPGNFFAGGADLSPDGRFLAFVSGADNLFVPAPPGPLSAQTSQGPTLTVQSASGEIPEIVDGQAVFTYEGLDSSNGPKPSRFFIEIPDCDVAAGEPDLLALFDPATSGPNVQIKSAASACPDCSFASPWVAEFDRGLGNNSPQPYTLAFDLPAGAEVFAGEVGFAFKIKKNIDTATIRGPACKDPSIEGGIPRVYLRDTLTGETQLVSGLDRSSCGDQAEPSDDPADNPDVVTGGQFVFFDSAADLTGDGDGEVDIFAYDPETCDVTNLSATIEGPAADPSSSDDGSAVAFESGLSPEIVVLDVDSGTTTNFGSGMDPELSADGTKLVYTEDVAGVSQVFLVDLAAASPTPVPISVVDGAGGGFLLEGGGAASVANDGRTAFETPLGDPDSDVLIRDVTAERTKLASGLRIGQNVCTTSPCGAFSPSISDDGRFVAYVLRGLEPFDEILIHELSTGATTPFSRMAGADADSLEPQLGAGGDFLTLSSFSSQLGGAPGGGTPGIFLEGPVDPSASGEAMLGVLDLSSCDGITPCAPELTGEPVTKGAVFAGDVAVVGSPVRLVETDGGLSVTSYGREGSEVALSEDYVCAVADGDASGNPGSFAACGARNGSTLSDLTDGGAPIAAEAIGLCGARAVALSSSGVLYVADLDVGVAASAVQVAEDFALGDDLDLDGDGRADSCLVAFRTLEQDLAGGAGSVGNRDVDTDDLAMFLLDEERLPVPTVVDCLSSTTDCPGQACEKFNYQAGRESVLYVVDETEENYGVPDACAIGTDANEDGQCGEIVRRCSAAGALTEGTAFGQVISLFSADRFQNDGENTVTTAGFCGPDPTQVRVGQFCDDDIDCLSLPGETCQLGILILSALADGDGDEIPDIADNCPKFFNPGQEDADQDGFGDDCDAFNCGDGIVQAAEGCDEGPLNGMPGSSCSLECSCQVNFEVRETLKPGSNGNTPITIFGSAAADGSGCLNLDNQDVGGVPAKGIEPMSLRLSATEPTGLCPTSGGAPFHNLANNGRYNSHLEDANGDGIEDLLVHIDTAPIGGDSSTTMVYLTGRLEGSCFEVAAPVNVSGN